jgi:hypothetical protein
MIALIQSFTDLLGTHVWYYLLMIAACWLFAVAVFANIFWTGRIDLLNKRGEDFFNHFPGLLMAISLAMVLTTYVVAAAVARPIVELLR